MHLLIQILTELQLTLVLIQTQGRCLKTNRGLYPIALDPIVKTNQNFASGNFESSVAKLLRKIDYLHLTFINIYDLNIKSFKRCLWLFIFLQIQLSEATYFSLK